MSQWGDVDLDARFEFYNSMNAGVAPAWLGWLGWSGFGLTTFQPIRMYFHFWNNGDMLALWNILTI